MVTPDLEALDLALVDGDRQAGLGGGQCRFVMVRNRGWGQIEGKLA
jgi:hypothetical protein